MAAAVLDTPTPAAPAARAPIEHIAIICSKGTLDMAYPA